MNQYMRNCQDSQIQGPNESPTLKNAQIENRQRNESSGGTRVRPELQYIATQDDGQVLTTENYESFNPAK